MRYDGETAPKILTQVGLLPSVERRVYDLCLESPLAIDQIANAIGSDEATALRTVFSLSNQGLIYSLLNQVYDGSEIIYRSVSQ